MCGTLKQRGGGHIGLTGNHTRSVFQTAAPVNMATSTNGNLTVMYRHKAGNKLNQSKHRSVERQHITDLTSGTIDWLHRLL